MPRTIRDSNLQTRAARARLRPQRRPYWCTLRPGLLHLGYAKRQPNKPGYWTVRSYSGKVAGGSPYQISRLPGAADDFEDANGASVLSYAQAQDRALARENQTRGTPAGPMTVAVAMQFYVEQHLRTHRRTANDAEGRAAAFGQHPARRPDARAAGALARHAGEAPPDDRQQASESDD
jgi:hypothetical protein